MTSSAVAVVGLGLMGARLAANLVAAGHRVVGYDKDPARLEAAAEGGVEPVTSVADAVEVSWSALLSLPYSGVSREVMLGGEGVVATARAGFLVFDTTTGHPDEVIDISIAAAESEVTYCDATLSGNAESAAARDLVVMVGGSLAAYRAGIPLFEAIGRSHHHTGSVGAGSRMKLIVNHVLSVHRMVLSESLLVAELAGMDLDVTLAVLKDSLAYSRAMDSWGDRMVAGDHDPPHSRLAQGLKDSRIIVEHGRSLGAPVDLAAVVLDALAEGDADGLGELDNSAVMEVLRRRVGLGRVE